ncbi:microcompartment protein PduM [Serratia aquatilis]|uniref:Microcompartment protein PduM n=1 Tax=Serratia aquatilis TaxID=1737515 RepID=A0ABV6EHL5_9GAMM
MTGSAEQIALLVSQVVARLAEREQRIYALRLQQLRQGIDPVVFLRHATLHLQLPDLGFIQRLAEGDGDDPAVSALHEAWSWGVRVHISLHQQLLAALPRSKLLPLPLSFSDHLGHQVRLSANRLLSYRDVATLDPCWLIVGRKTLLTPLAKECLPTRHIQLLRQE